MSRYKTKLVPGDRRIGFWYKRNASIEDPLGQFRAVIVYFWRWGFGIAWETPL